jgi:hypothetical protein
MTQKQLAAQKAGIIAHTKRLLDEGVPFEHYRVGLVLDAAFLLSRAGDPDWEQTYNAVLELYGELRPAAQAA